jgi:hypothetical protein
MSCIAVESDPATLPGFSPGGDDDVLPKFNLASILRQIQKTASSVGGKGDRLAANEFSNSINDFAQNFYSKVIHNSTLNCSLTLLLFFN